MFTEAVAAVCLIWYCVVVIVCGVGLVQLLVFIPFGPRHR
jgi:hypothetical protein